MKVPHVFRSYPLPCLLVSLFLLYLTLALLTPFPVWDETGYLSNARSHIRQSYFTEPFRFPLLEYLIAGWWLLVGESLLSARIFIMLCSLGTTALLYHWCKRRYPKLALPIAAAFGLNTLVLQWSIVAYAELPAVLCVTAAFVLLSDYENRSTAVLCAGILSGLSILLRYPMGLFALAALVVLCWERQLRSAITYSVGVALPLIPWMLRNHLQHGDFLWGYHAYQQLFSSWTSAQSPFVQIGNGVLVFTALIPFLAVGIHHALQHRSRPNLLLAVYVLGSLTYYLSIAQFKPSRYYLPFLAHAYLLIAIGISQVRRKWHRAARWAVWGSVLLSLIIASFPLINRMVCQSDHPLLAASAFLAQRMQAGDTVQGNAWPYLGYLSNLNAMPLKPDGEIFPATRFIVWESSIGIAYPKEQLSTISGFHQIAEFHGRCGPGVLILARG